MSFEEILKQDLIRTFFGRQEFAKKHMWNNNEITAVIDDDDMMSKFSSEYECLERGSHLILAPESEFEIRPELNTAVTFDGNLYTINEIKTESGMYAFFLEKKG